ncbi:hypothetical protein [Methylobacterium iners]|uniref:Formyl transferase N-terminal domain-containing protein n=1 Tax=Methylobacterium iners TaxID=418707 RepID=A0ABQ4RTJ3_9HYPH|nr:hypothetical protein [Methylobacterium iners]GJD94103.1 hypothetical protein OCOJLMKI_1304 [Methylobacterium iners]
MNVHPSILDGKAQGQATFGMANLRTERTGLPFIVFISQRGGAEHDVRVKISPAPKVRAEETSTYALRPYRCTDGPGLTAGEEQLLARWIERNMDVLVEYRDGTIAFTEDAIDRIKPI